MKKRRIEKLVSVILALLLLTSCTPQGVGKVSSTQEEWVLGEAYIPENNPDPVLVNREDAWNPTPISYTDKIVGDEIDIDAKILKLSAQGNEKWSNHIAVISSRRELQAIYDQEYTPYFDDSDRYVNFYDVEFFENNLIVMLISQNASSAFKYKIDKVTTHNGRMYIYWNNIDFSKEWGHSDDGVYFRTFISLPSKSMENIKDIVVYEDELFCD